MREITKKTIKEIPIIGERPEVPESWSIFNAPRPLYGHREWTGDCEHGTFYVAVDPNTRDTENFIERNISLDGWLVVYWTQEAAIEAAKQYLIREYPTDVDLINNLSEKKLLKTFKETSK